STRAEGRAPDPDRMGSPARRGDDRGHRHLGLGTGPGAAPGWRAARQPTPRAPARRVHGRLEAGPAPDPDADPGPGAGALRLLPVVPAVRVVREPPARGLRDDLRLPRAAPGAGDARRTVPGRPRPAG